MEGLENTVAAMEGGLDDLRHMARRARGVAPELPSRYLMSADSAAALGRRIDALMDTGTVYIAEPSMNAALTVVRQTAGHQTRYFKRVRQNVLVPLQARIRSDAAQALSEPLLRERMRVVSMFAPSDVEALQKLSRAAGDVLEDAEVLLEAMRTGSLERLRGQTVIVVGHIEDSAFVARGAGGQKIHSIEIEALERLAAASDTKLISAGCYSSYAGARAGFGDAVTDADMADAVRKAFQAPTNADLLEAFGQKRPLILSEEALDRFAQSRSLYLAQNAQGSTSVRAGALTVRLLSVAKRSAVREALATLVTLFPTGLLSVALMWRSNRAGFLRVFPKLPSPRLGETRLHSLAARIARELLFIAVGPIFATITVFTFFFGGWSHRENIVTWLWTCLRHPLQAGRQLLELALAATAVIAAYGIGLCLLALPALWLVTLAEQEAGGVWFWPTVTVLIGYAAVAGWGGWKAHRAFSGWLDSRPVEVR